MRRTNIHPSLLRGIAACIDDMDDDRPRPSQRALYRRLQDAQRRWRESTGKARDAAMADMVRISKAMDEA